MKKSNLSVNSKMNSNFWAKLKALFALPKWAKIFLGVLSVVAVAGLLGAFALQSWAKDKIQHGEFVLNGVDKGWQERLESGFAYDSRLYFERADFLLRSKVIAYIDIKDISWVSPIDKNAIIELKSQNRHIKFSTSQNLSEFNGQKLGVVEYKMDFSPLIETIVRYYVLIVVFVAVFWALWRVFIDLYHSLPPKNATLETTCTLDLTRKDYIFLAFTFTLCAGICAFSFWLGFPGYHHYDGITTYGFSVNNWHPVIVSCAIKFLNFVFGRHLYYLFLLNIGLFYLGLFFLIAGFYLHFKNPLAILLLFPTFIGNFYLVNFGDEPIYVAMNLYFALYAFLLFLILVPLNTTQFQKNLSKILWIFLFVLMFFAILWRHNAIFAVFPAFFVLCYIFLKNRGLPFQSFIKAYAVCIFFSAILCVGIVKGVPNIITLGKTTNPAAHIFLHQMAGACVPANDDSCFNQTYYQVDKTFEDVKKTYNKYMLHADYMGEDVFRTDKYKITEWLKAIAKHPNNFLLHEWRFFKGLWFSDADILIPNSYYIQIKNASKVADMMNDAPQNEHKITFTQKQEKIYTFFYEYRIVLNNIVGVAIGFAIMFICGILLFTKKFHNSLLIFSFSASFAGFWTAFITAAFNPITYPRYMVTVLPLSLMALFGFVAFMLDYLARKGNF